jgi:deoxyribodipyrimidine photo-lyase
LSQDSRPSIVWFRLDLRLRDNLALLAAGARRGPAIPVFIWAPEEEGNWAPGSASRWWLHRSLTSLEASLRGLGSRLIFLRGPSLRSLREVAAGTGAAAVFWNRRYEPLVSARDWMIGESLKKDGLEVDTFNAGLLYEPWRVKKTSGAPYQVFTPFWKACLASEHPPAPAAAPARLAAPRKWPASEPLESFALEPGTDWTNVMGSTWEPGEQGGLARLQKFVKEAVADYPDNRDRPDRSGTSGLSPHLHFGEIGPRQIRHALSALHGTSRPRSARAVQLFMRQIGWREFGHNLLYHFPHTTDKPLRGHFADIPRRADGPALRAWEKGETGYPIIDAGMRELWNAGWMHNRVRMIVASFLVKDLLLPWRAGAKWFWDTLVDADLANNTLGWQWTAGCGADAAPFFRVFNPILQGKKFDPDGSYVRRWVPELARMPARYIHAPWQAPSAILHAAGVSLGRTYPKPLVDHQQRRLRALAAYERAKRNPRVQH